jgi:hypothetical protein
MHKRALLPGTLEVLEKLMRLPELSGFNLAGGTALALQIGHRQSVDLDLFGDVVVSRDHFIPLFKQIGSVEVLSYSEDVLQLTCNEIKVDVVRYRYPLLKKPVIDENIRLLSIEDISAMKISAISNRGIKRDFYDLYFLLRLFPLETMLLYFKQKFHGVNLLHAIRSLSYFEDAERDLAPAIFEAVTWEQVKDGISKHVKKLSLKELSD